MAGIRNITAVERMARNRSKPTGGRNHGSFTTPASSTEFARRSTGCRFPKWRNRVALTSLILALDRVDNTLGHFVSYLRTGLIDLSVNFCLKIPRVFANPMDHVVLRRDVFDLSDVDIDLAYLDPPYGSNNEKMPPSRVRYAAYYHLWTTICLNDSPPLFGKALRRKDTSDKLGGFAVRGVSQKS